MTSRKKKNSYSYLLITLLAALFIKIFIFDFLHVSGPSMECAVTDGELIYLNKLAYGIKNPFSDKYFIRWKTPQKNQVVTFLQDNKTVVKRCVLTEGDSMEIIWNSKYNLLVGGEKIPITENQAEKLCNFKTVPEGFIFVLGDNYEESVDSREYGFVSVNSITGRILGK